MVDKVKLSPVLMDVKRAKGIHPYYQLGHEAYKARVELQMAQIDALPADWRALVHEYGWLQIREYLRFSRLRKAESVRQDIEAKRLMKMLGLKGL